MFTRFLFSLCLLMQLLLPLSVSAQVQSLIPKDGKIYGDSKCDFSTGEFDFYCFPLYVAYLIEFVFGFAGGFCLTQIIFAGYQIAIGAVSGEKEKGKERLKWALIGLALSVFSFLIVDFLVTGLLLPA